MGQIEITGIAHRNVHTVTAILKGAPPTKIGFNEATDRMLIKPDIFIATFVRSTEKPVWRCEEIEIGGGSVRPGGNVARGDRRSSTFDLTAGNPPWFDVVLNVLIKALPD